MTSAFSYLATALVASETAKLPQGMRSVIFEELLSESVRPDEDLMILADELASELPGIGVGA